MYPLGLAQSLAHKLWLVHREAESRTVSLGPFRGAAGAVVRGAVRQQAAGQELHSTAGLQPACLFFSCLGPRVLMLLPGVCVELSVANSLAGVGVVFCLAL